MNPISHRILGMAAFLFLLGCQGMPKAATTGHVIDVAIVDNEQPGDIAVNPGDEVRWINKRSAPVQVIFIDAVSNKKVSCKNHFGGFMTPGNTAKLATNQTASICFRDPGPVKYVVRMQSNRETGEITIPGTINVGEQGSQAMGQSTDSSMPVR
jgi:plastocyanin